MKYNESRHEQKVSKLLCYLSQDTEWANGTMTGYCCCYLVPDRMDHGYVAIQCREDNPVGGGDEKSPEGASSEPDAADELVVVADELVV